MKRLLLPLVLLLGMNTQAQDMFFRNDVGLGAAMTLGGFKAYGLAVSAEPKFFFNPNISAGLRLEGDVLMGGSIDAAGQEVSVGMSTRAAVLLKGEYYLGEGKNKPFAGLGLGQYTIANTTASGTGEASISAAKQFGFAPQLGMAFGNFRISSMYHIVPGNNTITLSSGGTETFSRNYLVIQLGFRTFGFGDE